MTDAPSCQEATSLSSHHVLGYGGAHFVSPSSVLINMSKPLILEEAIEQRHSLSGCCLNFIGYNLGNMDPSSPFDVKR